jgi:hypothetical protein
MAAPSLLDSVQQRLQHDDGQAEGPVDQTREQRHRPGLAAPASYVDAVAAITELATIVP